MWAADNDIETKYLIHDRDKKFTGEMFVSFWEASTKRIKTPVRAPMANAFVECWIGSLKKEALNHIVGLSREQINYVVNLWVAHYNAVRPHRGKGIENNVLAVDFTAKTKGEIQCRQKLGGLITEWHREAA
jgi:putative transposase